MMLSADGAALPSPARGVDSTTVRQITLALLLGLTVCGMLFHREAVAAIQVWIASTAFSHCFVVLPLAAYLAWDRRRLAALHPLRPAPWAALAAIPLAFAWFVADRVGVMEGRQLLAMCFVELLFLAVLGWRLWGAFSAALLYLFFLVPFGAFIVPSLQAFTTDFITTGLSILGIPYYADAFTIEISAGTFFVAEACAGLRFLIASIAFGVLYACLFYRSLMRRVIFIAASIVVPIIANGFRGLGIVVLGHLLGSAQAAAIDHILYGWLFFSVVLLLMILGGLPFREDGPPSAVLFTTRDRRPADRAPARVRQAFVAVWAVVVPMAIGPASALFLDGRAAGAAFSTVSPIFVPGPDCVSSASSQPELEPHHPATQHFICRGISVTTLVEVFSPRASPVSLLAALRKATTEGDAEDTTSSTLVLDGKPPRWQLVETSNPFRLMALSSWIDGAPSPGGLKSRFHQGWSSIFGSSHAPMLVTVIAELAASDRSPDAKGRERLEMTEFLSAQSTLVAQIAKISAMPRSDTAAKQSDRHSFGR